MNIFRISKQDNIFRWPLIRILRILLIVLTFSHTPTLFAGDARSYYLAMHNNALYNFYPEFAKGEPISKDEAEMRGDYYIEERIGDYIYITVMDNNNVYATVKRNLQYQTVWLKNESGVCEYKNEDIKHLKRQNIVELCRDSNGKYRRKSVKEYFDNVLTKTSNYDEEDNLIHYKIYDYADWVEYLFSPNRELIRLEELMRPGK